MAASPLATRKVVLTLPGSRPAALPLDGELSTPIFIYTYKIKQYIDI
jgi:hypothetical protein